jgi:pyruvate-ferredoxin/flavodoxin oxidoreductase
MTTRRQITVDGNEAAVSVAHRCNEVIVIYPITPSSTMGELSDEWSAAGRRNVWGDVPRVVEMQSEGGAAGAVHGALQAGSLSTTFTASQGLLLMLPNMYKIAGELTSFCMHVAARSIATHALSIFGDHSDVMVCRPTGFAMLCSASVQEAHDFALLAQAATLRARVPFIHFFDGFRTSHEVAKIEELTDDDILATLDADAIAAHRGRGLTPDHPVVRGTAQNPDSFFQAREAANRYYETVPGIVQAAMDAFAQRVGRQYHLFDYVGHPEAERIIVMMGSGTQTVEQTIERLVKANDERVGLVKVRLYRPFSIRDFIEALPASVRSIAVLDRTKEPGATGEPLYQDVVAALHDPRWDHMPTPRVIGGRYGLGSKEFTPAMAKAVFDELASIGEGRRPKHSFTVGILDDVTFTSLPVDPTFTAESDDTFNAIFYGLGSDGTVGANKNTIKIIGEETDNYAQGYFVYDSKKSGAMTVSHLRFGPKPILSQYLIDHAHFVGCHQFQFLDRYDVLEFAADGAVFLLNSPLDADSVWQHLPHEIQARIIEKRLRFYTIDALKVARETGMGSRINTIMQTCFFAISGVLPGDKAIAQIKHSIEKTYARKGDEVVRRNFAAVDQTLANLHRVAVPTTVTAKRSRLATVSGAAPDFVQRVTAVMMAGKGDLLPVSAFPVDGTWPTGTSKWEKRSIATEAPLWDEDLCIQCNKCAFVCPHAAIRAKVYEPAALSHAPESFRSSDYKAPDFKGSKYTIQLAPDDCTGCGLCVMVCPAKDKSNPRRKAIDMTPIGELIDSERANFAFFEGLADPPRERITRLDVKGSQFLAPLFEFSGACAGCGETPYVKLLTQLFGDHTVIANATGCSSIYGGNLPTTPYTTNADGRGPAWSNSLFEDNAEFGLGIRLGIDAMTTRARELLRHVAPQLGDELVGELLANSNATDAALDAQRRRIDVLRGKLRKLTSPVAQQLERMADYLAPKAVWIVGGDGWAYDIGFGGLDHVLSQQHKVNILVLDTEVYSNTGGQASKATPIGAAAKFATTGKAVHKKDLGLIAMSYGHVYVASVAFGAKDNHTVQAFREAAQHPGPSLIIAYSPCIAHGYDLRFGVEQQRLAAASGIWPLYRFDPQRSNAGEAPLQLDTMPTRATVNQYMRNEQRFRMIERMDPERFRELSAAAVAYSHQRVSLYDQLSRICYPSAVTEEAQADAVAAETKEA